MKLFDIKIDNNSNIITLNNISELKVETLMLK